MDLFPVWLSLQVSLLATLVTAVIGVPLAWALARRQGVGRELLDAAIVTSLVPPTVLGYYLLVLIAVGGPVGRVLDRMGIELAFTWRAAVIAGCIGSLPLLVRSVQAGFEAVDRRLAPRARARRSQSTGSSSKSWRCEPPGSIGRAPRRRPGCAPADVS